MFNRILNIAAACTLLLASGCVSTPHYRPFDGSVGYSEALIAPDVVSITFNGDSTHSTGQATYYATLRAAEVAFERNKPFFELYTVDRAYNVKSQTVPGRVQYSDHFDRRSDRVTTNADYTPGNTTTSNMPVVTLEAKLLTTKTERAFTTDDILKDAVAKGVVFGPMVNQAYGVVVKK